MDNSEGKQKQRIKITAKPRDVSAGSVDEKTKEDLGKALDELDQNTEKLIMLDSEAGMYQMFNKRFRPFPYQERAVRDFIFKFHRKGILSDQVGMGKTIEAGMIISELACLRELESLLIVVPSGKMVQKWEVELSEKFGLRNVYKTFNDADGNPMTPDMMPRLMTVRSMRDVYALLFEAVDALEIEGIDVLQGATLDALVRQKAREVYKDILTSDVKYRFLHSSDSTKASCRNMYREIIPKFVDRICRSLQEERSDLRDLSYSEYCACFPKDGDKIDFRSVAEEGTYSIIIEYYMQRFTGDEVLQNCWDVDVIANSIAREFAFYKAKKGKDVIVNRIAEILRDDKRHEHRVLLSAIATQIRKAYPFLIICNEVFDKVALLNTPIYPMYSDVANKYIYVNPGNTKNYTVFDLLIDMGYATLIVDEAHNYINVAMKNAAESTIRALDPNDPGWANYHLFELFKKNPDDPKDPLRDRYLVKRECSYVKLLTLANRAKRKIFMTATPIKSDMIDFYLLTLLKGTNWNVDMGLYQPNEKGTAGATYAVGNYEPWIDYDALSGAVNGLISVLLSGSDVLFAYNYITELDFFCFIVSKAFEKIYSNPTTDFTKRDALKKAVVHRLNHFEGGWRDVQTLWNDDVGKWDYTKEGLRADDVDWLRTAITIEDLKTAAQAIITADRDAFEQNFTVGTRPIKSIADLAQNKEGLFRWRSMYESLGIRTTRHQTNRIKASKWLPLFTDEKRNNYYPKLPLWSRRNGTVISIKRIDRYFDQVISDKLDSFLQTIASDQRKYDDSILTEKKEKLQQIIRDLSEVGVALCQEAETYLREGVPTTDETTGKDEAYILEQDRINDVRKRMIVAVGNAVNKLMAGNNALSSLQTYSGEREKEKRDLQATVDSLFAKKLLYDQEQKAIAEIVFPKWLGWIEEHNKEVERINNLGLSEAEKKKKIRTAEQEFKREIAEFLFKNVIDKSMRGELHEPPMFRQRKVEDYFLGRMHLMLKLILGEMEDCKSDFDPEKNAKVLVFADDSIYEKLYRELQSVGREGVPFSGREQYKAKYSHYPFSEVYIDHSTPSGKANTDRKKWVVTNSIEELKLIRENALVIVPPNKYEEGVDLQAATHLINFDILHSPLAMEQRIGRIDRVKAENSEDDHDIFIYAFTPLNDWSGFSTCFHGKYLQLFNRWNGDTTGIVSFPVGSRENSSSFESIVSEIEKAYTIVSDHADGKQVAEIYERVSCEAKKDEGEYNETTLNGIIKEGIRNLRFPYRKEKKGSSEELYYSPSGETESKGLDEHINLQAARLEKLLKNINTSAQEQFGEQYVKMSEELRDKSQIAVDLDFLYKSHFYFDLIENNLQEEEHGGQKQIGIDRIDARFRNSSTVIIRAIEAFLAGSAPDYRKAGKSEGGIIVDESKSTVNYFTDAVADVRKKGTRSYKDFVKSNSYVTKAQAKAAFREVTDLYRKTVEKYVDALLQPYVLLCRHVKARLDNMAMIIEDGAVEDLSNAVDIVWFKKENEKKEQTGEAK